MISTDFLQICSRENEPIVRQGQRKRHSTSKRFPPKHLQTATPETRIPLHLQRKREASRNTAPAQRNDTSSLRSYDSRTGPTKTAHHKSSNSRVLRFPTGRAIAQSYELWRTVANFCGRLHNIRRTRLHPQTPKMKREPYATHSEKNIRKKIKNTNDLKQMHLQDSKNVFHLQKQNLKQKKQTNKQTNKQTHKQTNNKQPTNKQTNKKQKDHAALSRPHRSLPAQSPGASRSAAPQSPPRPMPPSGTTKEKKKTARGVSENLKKHVFLGVVYMWFNICLGVLYVV